MERSNSSYKERGSKASTNTDEVCSGETAGDGTQVIKEHTEVCAPGSIGGGIAEEWRGGIPHKVEGGTGALMIGADSKQTQQQKKSQLPED